MTTPILDFRYVEASKTLTTQNNVKIEIRREHTWKTEHKKEEESKLVVLVEGELKDKDKIYDEQWSFDWPKGDWNTINESLRLLLNDIEQRQSTSAFELETSVHVYEWLKVGFIQNDGGRVFYIEFTKAGQKITATLKDIAGLQEFRTLLYSFFN